MDSLVVDEIVLVLIDEYWAPLRAHAGMTLPAHTAPSGVLTDNEACVHLRKALVTEVGEAHIDVRASELGFYHVGDYYAVLSRVRVPPGTDVRQRNPMRIYTKEQNPRLLMTVYM